MKVAPGKSIYGCGFVLSQAAGNGRRSHEVCSIGVDRKKGQTLPRGNLKNHSTVAVLRTVQEQVECAPFCFLPSIEIQGTSDIEDIEERRTVAFNGRNPCHLKRTMSNPRQDEVDAFFSAINSPSLLQQRQQDQRQDSITTTTSLTTSTITHATSNSGNTSQLEQRSSQPLFSAANSATASPLPRSSSPSLQSSSSGPPKQPGMTPAIQKGSVSLGLALGGSGFRRKPLFEQEDSDDEHASATDSDRLTSRHKGTQGKTTNMGKSQSTTLRELTGSEHDDGTLDDHESEGSEHDHVDSEDDGDEDDANSETPLNPREQIRGLE
ncbi:hypothetical protein B0O80DRAFT_131599 [Mortierella sp. GBAus27b]|nr:hypothetical protein B0O80DRAFT_131599 [Mortierella sp. GBAus27b]